MGEKETTENKMVGWPHQLDEHEVVVFFFFLT